MTEPLVQARVPYERCPLCDGSAFEAIVTASCREHPLYHPALPPSMTWRRCAACEHVFTDGYFTAEAAALVFGRVNPHQRVGADAESQRYVSARIVERVARHVESGAWLDVGFGNASLLFTAAEWGYSAVGIDLRRDNVTELQRLGFEAHAVDCCDLDQPGRFSVVSMADVLEHMPFPKEGLAAARRLLRPSGVLMASMPNSESMVWRLLDAGGQNPYWGELEHYHNFSRTRLYALLEESGFRPLAYGISERYRTCMEVVAARAD